MRTGPRALQLVVRTLNAAATRGTLELGHRRVRCALGRSGRRVGKREGDGASPIGAFALREVFYRADRGPRPLARMPVHRTAPADGWCDSARDANYNRFVRHPYRASAEHLWRCDGLYDLLVVLGYNDRPVLRGRGSAIFIHCARPGYAPTEGCIALARADLVRLMPALRRGMHLRIV
jgi:L,D-peptidoglycan transpeptidase YkuD (ErfK/YbiS/YcfS/YnhG family)